MNAFKISSSLIIASLVLAACAPATPGPFQQTATARLATAWAAKETASAAATATEAANQQWLATRGARSATAEAAYTPTPARRAPQPAGHFEVIPQESLLEERGGNYYRLPVFLEATHSWYGVAWWSPESAWVLWTPLTSYVEAPPLLSWEEKGDSVLINWAVGGDLEQTVPYLVIKGEDNTLLLDFQAQHVLVLRQAGTFIFNDLGLTIIDGMDVYDIHFFDDRVRVVRR